MCKYIYFKNSVPGPLPYVHSSSHFESQIGFLYHLYHRKSEENVLTLKLFS